MGLTVNKIHQGDCIKLLDQLEPGSIDLVFADPPFNIGYDYDVYHDKLRQPRSISIGAGGGRPSVRPRAEARRHVLADHRRRVCGRTEGDVPSEEHRLVTCGSWVVWYYTFGVNCARGFSRSHTHLFHFVVDPKQFTFNADDPAIRVPSARALVYNDKRANPNGRLPDNTWILRPQDAPDSFSAEEDTWFFSRVAGTFKEREGFHGCQMPEQLLGRIIRASSNPDEVVLDPFGGSGTTLVVAKKLGRKWLGCELSADYAARIKDRLAETRIGAPLDGAADPLTSAPATPSEPKQRRHRAQKSAKKEELFW